MSATAPRFRGAARLGRGAVLGGTCLILAEAGHTAAGGAMGGTGPLLAAPVALALGCAWTERRRGSWAMLAFIVAVQALLHVLMVFGAGHGAHAGQLVPGSSMLVAHLAAAAVFTVLLAHGDELVHAWMAFAASLRVPLLALPAIPLRGADTPHWQAPADGASRLLVHSLAGRGPPRA